MTAPPIPMTEAEIAEARQMEADGYSRSEIAGWLGCTLAQLREHMGLSRAGMHVARRRAAA